MLKKLLEKYYAGASSADEEKKILELLRRKDLPVEFYDDRVLMEGLHGEDDIPEPSTDLKTRIITAIDDSEKGKRIISGKRRLYSVVSVAAGILIIISFWFILVDKSSIKDTYNDPQLAYNETVEVLYRVSANLNKGMYPMEELTLIGDTKSKLEMIPESRNAVTKELDALKYIGNSIRLLNMNVNEKTNE